MSEESNERSPQKLAKSRRDYLAQVKMLSVDERAQETAKINKALGIKTPKAPLLLRLWIRSAPPTFGCSARWAVTPKSKPR